MHTLALVENIFFLILIAIVGLIRWISQAAEAKKNTEAGKRINPQPANAPPPRAPAQSEEERIRRFMEALGVPAPNAPPPKVQQPRQVVPKRRQEPKPKKKIMPVDPFPRPRTTWFPGPAVDTPPIVVATPTPFTETPPLPSVETTAPVLISAPASLPEYEISSIGADRKAAGWAARLATSGGLRDAFILREILGPPRSMQEIG